VKYGAKYVSLQDRRSDEYRPSARSRSSRKGNRGRNRLILDFPKQDSSAERRYGPYITDKAQRENPKDKDPKSLTWRNARPAGRGAGAHLRQVGQEEHEARRQGALQRENGKSIESGGLDGGDRRCAATQAPLPHHGAKRPAVARANSRKAQPPPARR